MDLTRSYPPPGGFRRLYRSLTLRLSVTSGLVVVLLAMMAGGAWAAISFRTPHSQENTPSAAHSLELDRPADAAEGDLMLAQLTFLKGSDTLVLAPQGWVLVERTNQSSNIGSAIYRKFVGASDTGPYTWAFSEQVSANGGILAYTGVDPTNPVIDKNGSQGSSGNRVAPSIASESGAWLVAFFSQKKNTTMTAQSDMALMTSRYTINPSGDERQSRAFDQTGVANPTGVRTMSGENEWVAQSVTLRAATTVTVNKVVVNDAVDEPEDDDGKFDLLVNGTVKVEDVGHGGTTGKVFVSAGDVTVSELAGTDTDLDDYITEIECDNETSSEGASHEFTIASGEDVICTITNTRKAELTVRKLLDPEDDDGVFDLFVNDDKVLEDATHDDFEIVKLAPGEYTVGEAAGTGTDLDNYTAAFSGDCDDDGEITLAAGEVATCTITNTRKSDGGTGDGLALFLHNNPTPPVGHTRMQHPLPLNSTVPTATTLYNYDTDRDAFPGRLIQKGGSATTTDRVKYQNWQMALTEDLEVSGDVELVFWSAMKDFKTDKRGYVVAFLMDGSTVVATGSLNPTTKWQGGASTWVEKAIIFSGVDRTFTSGTLQLRLIVHSNSDDDMWFAYDTVDFPSRLELP